MTFSVSFSNQFCNQRLYNPDFFICSQLSDNSWQIDFSDQPQSSGIKIAVVERVRDLIQEIQKEGSLSFVQHCRKKLAGRIIPDIFLNNLTLLFQSIHVNIPSSEEKIYGSGSKRAEIS